MARTVKPDEVARKRSEILDAAQRLIYTKGYQRMTIQDIRSALGMSSGAFFHYFPSKAAVLTALIERIQEGVEAPIQAFVDDPALSGIDKLKSFFTTLEQARVSQQAFIFELAQVWLTDDNVLVREKVEEALAARRLPLLTRIIQQGAREGALDTHHPERAAEIILALARSMGTTITRQMLAARQSPDHDAAVAALVDTYSAYADAVERVLGAPPFFERPDAAAFNHWLFGAAPSQP